MRRKKMIKLLLLILPFLFLLSCNKTNEQKLIATQNYFSVNFRILENVDSLKDNSLFWDHIEERNLGETKINYTKNKKFHLFDNTYLEIQFPSVRYRKDDRYVPLNCLIFNGLVSDSKIYLDHRDKCFYVLWLNSPTSNGLGHYEQKWEIGTSTDTIYSNLNISVINRIFPKFQGILIDGKISEVIIHKNYNVSEWWFYQDIEFVGFDRFEDTYKFYKDSLYKSKSSLNKDKQIF